MASLRGVARVAGFMLLALVLLEALLQAGAWLVSATGRDLPSGWLTGRQRVLCVGDSHTYGLYLDRDEAYPAQLQALWNGGEHATLIETLNLGFPGTNSSRLKRDLPELLEILQPDVVIALVGANDFWTVPVGEEKASAPGGATAWLKRSSRVIRLLYAFRGAFGAADLEVRFVPLESTDERKGVAKIGGREIDMGWEKSKRPSGEPALMADQLKFMVRHDIALGSNLAAMARQVKSSGAQLILMTYGSEQNLYGAANRSLRRIAQTLGVPIVDVAAAFSKACPDDTCSELLFRDKHPNASGYRLVAESLACQMDPEACRGAEAPGIQ